MYVLFYYLFFLGRSGEGLDIVCGRRTNLTVVNDLQFPFRDPPNKCKRTVEEVKKMSGKQHVSS